MSARSLPRERRAQRNALEVPVQQVLEHDPLHTSVLQLGESLLCRDVRIDDRVSREEGIAFMKDRYKVEVVE